MGARNLCTFQKRRCFERNNFVSVAQLHNILSHVFNTQSDNPSSLKLFLHDSSFPRPHLPVVVAHLPTLLSSNCSDFPPWFIHQLSLSDMQQAFSLQGIPAARGPAFMSGVDPRWKPTIGSSCMLSWEEEHTQLLCTFMNWGDTEGG